MKIVMFAVLIGLIMLIVADPVEQPSLDLAKLKPVLKEYLKTETQGIISPIRPGGDIFIVFDTLGADIDGGMIKAYINLLCQEYYPEGDSLIEGAGVSIPIALSMIEVNDKYEILSYQAPRDGEIFAVDLKRIFPERCLQVHRQMLYDRRCFSDDAYREASAFFFPEKE
jgi:hypothetical protein